MLVKIYSFEISESTLHSFMFTRDNLILSGIMYIYFSAKSNFHLGVMFTEKFYSKVNNDIQMCNCSLFNMMESKYSFYKAVSFNFDYPVAILFFASTILQKCGSIISSFCKLSRPVFYCECKKFQKSSIIQSCVQRIYLHKSPFEPLKTK